MQAALIIIDAQQEYFAPHGQWVVKGGAESLVQIQRLLSVWRENQGVVVHVVHEALDPGSPVFRLGSPGVLMHPDIKVMPNERLVTKHFPGAFTQTPLDAYLRYAGVDTVVITGYQTHHCCDATTRQARERGFQVIFVGDATGTRDLELRGETVRAEDVQRVTLAAMTGFAEVLNAEETIARLNNE
ncbi:cysteine hydrolase family protein [Sulfobacillus sp. hq2]|uniref:Isochorismatase-like domain-containing protein n=1 Tax=Sulfobacillus thermotolerans TaxID=338644 RepID=A0ABM6RPT8_9FIRM|nr:cysteine hydrolase family protein [Sulfobacillus sp. hq2]AUW93459.1 hypothetical protein BXT84_05440 [Sulfobacillus thermotolerans]MCY0907506.1 cysteine hydrolase family protein [Sulfobacillus thermotolerans]